MKKMKKALSFVMASMLCCSAFPMGASADDSLKYDFNLDGKFGYADVQTLLLYFAENQTTTSFTQSDEVRAKCAADGDLTGNGAINAADAHVLIKYYVENHIKGDVNEDGKLTPEDASLILSHYADKATGVINEWDDVDVIQFMQNAGDIDGDSLITVVDASVVLSEYVKSATSV